MKNKLKYLIPVFAVSFILTSLIIVFSSWILTLSTNIGSEEIETIYDPTLENYILENSFEYNKENKYPHMNLGDKLTEFQTKYSVEYFRKNVDGKLSSTTITINAGTYVARYFNISSRIYTDYEYTIKPVEPELQCNYSTSERKYYSPTLCPTDSDFVCTGYYGDGILSGTITYTKNLPNEGTTDINGLSLKITCVFKPTNQNYSSAVCDLYIPLYAVAHINTAYFSRIESALENASTGNEVRIVMGTNPTIYEDCIVNSGVTLHLNYAIDSVNNSTATYPISSDNSSIPALTLCNSIKLNDNITLTVASGGKLEIGGELAAQNPCGRTVGNHCELVMGSSSKIICNGTIDCYGYIKEKTKNNGSLIEIKNGDLYLPFIVYDFKGGSITYGIYTKFNSDKCPPFNEFGLSNINSEVTLDYHSNVYGYANLYAGSQHNHTVISLVGNSSSYLIQMTSETFSYIEANYDEVLDKLFLDMYGGAEINSMSITIKVLGTITISTQQVYFPITFRQQITMNANSSKGQNIASYSMNQRYKLMPGALLQVNENVVLEATSLAVYKEEDYTVTTYVAGLIYPSGKGDAQLIVNGELHVGDMGGVVSSFKEGAFLFINSGTNIPIREVVSSSGSSILTTVTFTSNSVNALINTYQAENVPLESNATIGIYECKSYSYNGTKYYYWDQYDSDEVNMYTIKYVTNSEDTILSDRIVYSLDSSIILNEIVLPDSFSMIKKGYQFNGWFIDSNLSTPADNYNLVNSEITVYASWIIKNYSIGYESIVENSEEQITLDISGITNSLQSEYTINSEKPNLPDIVIEGYDFIGWYYYEDGEFTSYESFTVDHAIDIIFIARFKVTEKPYEIRYQLINSSNNVVESKTLVSNLKDISSFNINNYISNIIETYNNINTSSSLYFEGYNKTDGTGWYTNSSLTIPYTSLSSELVTDATGEYQIITLYGKILNKVPITYISSASSVVLYYIPNTQIELYNPEDNTDDVIHVWENTTEGIFLKYGNEFVIPTTNLTLNKIDFIKTTINAGSHSTINLTVSGNNNIIDSSYTIYNNTANTALTKGTYYIRYNSSVSITTSHDGDQNKDTTTITSGGNTIFSSTDRGASHTYVVKLKTTYTISTTSANCITADTLITLADGTKKMVKDLLPTDLLLVFNHITGKFEAAPIILNDTEPEGNYRIINLKFNDGTVVKVVFEHGFFDLTLNEYVYIRENNAVDFIGHKFFQAEYDGMAYIGKEVILVDVYITEEITTVYSPVTVQHLNYFTEGMLSMPGGIPGLFNIFEYGDNLTYDAEQMQKDIETYGLYTYDDFKEYVPYEVYQMFLAQYFKVAVGKGMLTFDDIVDMIYYYLGKNDII